ncbi:hypothetical protein EV361DRAFT_954954 [Lentinula raphanica]|nr:hypothetical protein EV361DRAFT_954954 [Lentinula raphanica]
MVIFLLILPTWNNTVPNDFHLIFGHSTLSTLSWSYPYPGILMLGVTFTCITLTGLGITPYKALPSLASLGITHSEHYSLPSLDITLIGYLP